MLCKDFPQAFYNLVLHYCMQGFISIQRLPSCLSYSDFQQFGYDDPGYVLFFPLICALIFLGL